MSEGAASEVVSADAARFGSRLAGLHLPPSQRRVVRYIVANPQDAALLTSTALAERIGVSQATVTRVAVALGFAGFAELRAELRRVLYDAPPVSGVQPAVQAAIGHLQTLQSMLDDPAPLDHAVELLASSRPLPIVALRISAPLGLHFTYRLTRCHPDVRPIDRGDSVGADRLATAVHDGATALLCVNLPRHAAETIGLLHSARKHGLRIVMLTDSAMAPGADLADVVFAVPVGTRLIFDSHAAPTVLASILVDGIADALGRTGQEKLEALEEMATEWGAFLDA